MFQVLVRANCVGLLSTYFLSALAVFVAAGCIMHFFVQTYRFCSDGMDTFCVPCPPHATCQGLQITKCDYGYVNNGYECLETTKTPKQLANLHDRIMRIYAQNVSADVNSIYEHHFERECSATDFKSAVRYTRRWKTTPGGKRIVPISWFSFKRSRATEISFGAFSAVIATLWLILVIARLIYDRT